MELRIGINVGDVLVDGDNLYGDGVNIAARLEGIAKPGTICLSEDAYRQVKARLDIAVNDLGATYLGLVVRSVPDDIPVGKVGHDQIIALLDALQHLTKVGVINIAYDHAENTRSPCLQAASGCGGAVSHFASNLADAFSGFGRNQGITEIAASLSQSRTH